MTSPTRAAYRFLAHSVALLVIYAVVSLIAGLNTPAGASMTAAGMLNRLDGLAAALLDLVIAGGLIGGGIYALCPPERSSRTLWIAGWLWSLVAILTLAAALVDPAAGSLLPLFQVGVMALVLVEVARGRRVWSPVAQVWTVGVVLHGVCAAAGAITTADFLQTTALHAAAASAQYAVGDLLAVWSLAYWLMRRFSTASALWADASLYTVAGLLALAGALVTLTRIAPVGVVVIEGIVGVGAFALPILTLITGAHAYYALSHRNHADTLAAHWTALAVLLIVIGVGGFGAIHAAAWRWTAGTRLSDVPPALTAWALVAVVLGAANQIAAELRAPRTGDLRRVTGLAPFWLVAFGMVGGGLALAGAGLVQVYLERVLGLDFAAAQTLIAPVYAVWRGALAMQVLGVIIYGFLFYLRNPPLRTGLN